MLNLTIHIRTGRKADVPGVDALLARAYPQLLKDDYPPSVMVTAVPLMARAQPGLVTCGTYYVAVTDVGHVVAAGGWTRRNPATGQTDLARGSIRHFATDPDFTRKGIAGALMSRCLREAREADLRAMDCFSTRTAVPFYEHHGFARVAEVGIELRAGVTFPAVQMVRDL